MLERGGGAIIQKILMISIFHLQFQSLENLGVTLKIFDFNFIRTKDDEPNVKMHKITP